MKKQELSILIPTYNCDCTALVTELSRQAEAIEHLSYEIIVADDGSDVRSLAEACRQIEQLPCCRFIDRGVNCGRAAIRNVLAREARYAWLLFLDSHMTIANPWFIANYLDCEGQIIYGGYIVGKGESSNLRYLYEKQCEPEHRPEVRQTRPFQHFHTGNFMVSREAMLAHPFDERFRRYGYEDVLFGKELKQAGYSITHMDNPANFATYEANSRFVEKTEESLCTLHEFRDDLRGYSQLLTFAENIHLDIIKTMIRLWHLLFGGLERRQLCGKHPNLQVFKLYKIGYYLSIKN